LLVLAERQELGWIDGYLGFVLIDVQIERYQIGFGGVIPTDQNAHSPLRFQWLCVTVTP